MAVKAIYIHEFTSHHNVNLMQIELCESLNFICPCYMLPFKNTIRMNDCCDNHECNCRLKILPIDRIKERLRIFVGKYFDKLDLTRSCITGSAMAVCPFISPMESKSISGQFRGDA